MKLRIYSAPTFQAEKQYVVSVLVEQLLGVSVEMVWEADATDYRMALPNGHSVRIRDHFFGQYVEGQHWLQAASLPNAVTAGTLLAVSFMALYGTPTLERVGEDWVLDTDLFACTFLMLTRWEETVQPEALDMHGRFPARASLAQQHGFLGRAVVHEWAALLAAVLQAAGGGVEVAQTPFRLHYSHDVDHPRLWMEWWGRGRSAFSAIKQGGIGRGLGFWAKYHALAQRDPFDTFDYLMAQSEVLGQHATFYFLGKRPRTFDCWYALESPIVRRLMDKIAVRGHLIGFHPSREAATDATRFAEELSSVRSVSPLPIVEARHHYLCFSAPRSWRFWAEHGLQIEASLGYSDAPGFRAGMCVPFPVFDVLARQTLPVLARPLLAMDVTFPIYQKATPTEMLATLRALAAPVRQFGGEFTLLWHNSSFGTYLWAPFQPALEAFLADFTP